MYRARQLTRNLHPGGSSIIYIFDIACTYNLVFNAAIMAEEGFGYVLSLDKLVNTGKGSSLCFRPLKPDLKVNLSIAWKKYQIFSKASQKFLEYLKKEINA